MRPQQRIKRGVYLLPNLLTTFGLFSGFYAMIAAISGNFIAASIAIFVAILWDGLDGRVARMTNTETDFGAQYDSMADVLSFALAPAFCVYLFAFSNWGRPGLVATFIYAVGGVLRLARFNTQIGAHDKRYFQGLPSPAAAALIAGMIWVSVDFPFFHTNIHYFAWAITVGAAVLMVSTVRYESFKEMNLKVRAPFKVLLLAPVLMMVVFLEPSLVLFCFFLIYALSGPLLTAYQIRRRRLKKIKKSGDVL